jgi:hypothetical protein
MSSSGIANVTLFKKTCFQSSLPLNLVENQDICRESAVMDGVEFFVTKIKDGEPKFDCPLAAYITNSAKPSRSHQERKGKFIVHASYIESGQYLSMTQLVTLMEKWRNEMNK